MTRLLPVTAAVIVLLFSGVVHGLWTDRWTERADVSAAAARLSQLPMRLGDWQGEALASSARPGGGLAGAVSRRYVHRPTGRSVTLFLGCGRPGTAAIHTPDVCYAASGFDGEKKPFTLPAGSAAAGAQFYTAHMRREKSTDKTQLRIFWSWSSGEKWEVAENPRFAFVHRPILYKLYVLRETGPGPQPLEADPCVEFMEVLLPALQRTVLSAS
jgi:hypothetical protein